MSNYLCDVVILVIPDTPLVREANTREDSLNFLDAVLSPSLSLFYLSIYMSNYMYVYLCDVILVIPDTPLIREANTKEDSLSSLSLSLLSVYLSV